MYAVDSYAAVRRFVFVEGKSRREAARVFGLSRDTISKMCRFFGAWLTKSSNRGSASIKHRLNEQPRLRPVRVARKAARWRR